MADNQKRDEARSPFSVGRAGAFSLGAAALIAAWFLWPAATSQEVGDKPSGANAVTRQTVETRLQAEAFRISRGLPRQIDENTILKRVSAFGTAVTYDYEIKAAAEEEEVVRNFAENSVLPQVCLGKMRKDMTRDGISYHFAYDSDNFRDPVVISIDEATCRARFTD